MDDEAAPRVPLVAGTGKSIFILDARHGVEERYLREWLRGREYLGASADDSDCVVLPISVEGPSLSLELERLDAMLGAHDDTPVVPMRVAWRVPHLQREHGLRLRDLLLGDPRHPGRLRAALVLMRDRDRAHCLVGAFATIGDLRRRFAGQVAGAEHSERHAFARFVARAAAVTLDIEERGIQGSRYKVPRFVADHILASREFRPALERIADEQGRPPAELLAESRHYLKEMVSTPSALFLDLRARLDRFLFTRGYDRRTRFDPAELERLRQRMRTHPTVLLFTHKSYIDASLPTLLLYSNDLPMLHTVRRHQHGLRRFRDPGAALRWHLHPALVPGQCGLQARAAQVCRVPAGEALSDVVGAGGHALAPRQADAATLRPAEVHARCRARCRDRERAHLRFRHEFRLDPRRRRIRRRTDRPGEEARVVQVVCRLRPVAAPAHGFGARGSRRAGHRPAGAGARRQARAREDRLRGGRAGQPCHAS